MIIWEINSDSDNESLYNSQNCQTEDQEYTFQQLNVEFGSYSLFLCQWDSIWESRCWHCWREDKYDEWWYSQIWEMRHCQTVSQWQKSRRWTFYEFLLHKIVYIFMLEINFLSIFMLTEMKLHMIVNKADKFSKIQLLKNHDLTIVNLIFMNNLYFLDVVKNLSMWANIIKKSNHRQWQNSIKLIKIWHWQLRHLNINKIKNIQ